MGIEELKASAKAKVERDINSVKGLLTDKTLRPTIPEDLFVSRYLPALKEGNHLAFNELLRLVGGPNKSALVLDKQGEVLYELPPLIRSPNLVNKGMVKDVDLSALGKDVIAKDKSRPQAGENMLNNFIANTSEEYNASIESNQVEIRKLWLDVFARYEDTEVVNTTTVSKEPEDDLNDEYE